ncbi:DUF3892 domain-containing protein [Bradyrhizobium sp. CCBAU 21362]|uniref:DUF3892 domain-containing protein n=1 Tax=Bradyrhizobium sp. CCBAU 21362 TaxID=1325082 RepID=UPI0023054F14|nr:DUF3892 domain-containing protein [Bradyrhizobium sp. CCBAU 21362]
MSPETASDCCENSELGLSSGRSRAGWRHVDRYKTLLQAADEPSRGHLDGRGALTEAGLAEFCRFFFDVSAGQVRFMQTLLNPAELMNRIEIWTEEEVREKGLQKGSWRLLREAILVGEFPRSRATELTGYQVRQARAVLSDLVNSKLLVSDTTKGNVRLGFPSEVVEQGKSVWVVVRNHEGRDYLKTQNDNFLPNNLLSLPECRR